jgi:hypothetical protein
MSTATAHASSMSVTIQNLRQINKGVILVSVDLVLEIPGAGPLELYDCLVMRSGNRTWVGMPGKPQIGQDGRVMKDERGKTKYVAILKWSSKQSGDRFSDGVALAIKSEYGEEALDGAGT